jgi:hypothetical protein
MVVTKTHRRLMHTTTRSGMGITIKLPAVSGTPRIFFGGVDSTNSVEDRGQRE